MSDIRRGLIIVNTGPGKGKTTAAMDQVSARVHDAIEAMYYQDRSKPSAA